MTTVIATTRVIKSWSYYVVLCSYPHRALLSAKVPTCTQEEHLVLWQKDTGSRKAHLTIKYSLFNYFCVTWRLPQGVPTLCPHHSYHVASNLELQGLGGRQVLLSTVSELQPIASVSASQELWSRVFHPQRSSPSWFGGWREVMLCPPRLSISGIERPLIRKSSNHRKPVLI